MKIGLIIKFLLLILVFFLYFYLTNLNSYNDFFSGCNIKIVQDTKKGNRQTIIKAINLIKDKDSQTYQNLCKYVDTIEERNCMVTDQRGSGIEGVTWEKNCYIKGARSIYIDPNWSGDQGAINQRVEQITKLSNFSKAYWESKN